MCASGRCCLSVCTTLMVYSVYIIEHPYGYRFMCACMRASACVRAAMRACV